MTTRSFALVAALAAAMPLGAQAATLTGVTIDTRVGIFDDDQGDGNQAVGSAVSLFGDDLSIAADIFGGEAPGSTGGLGPIEGITVDLFFGSDGEVDMISQLFVDGPDGTALTGTAIRTAFDTDMAQVLFQIDGGALAATFGSSAVLTLSAFGFDVSSGPGAFFEVGGPVGLDIAINPASPAPIPLPASAILLLGGLAAMRMAGRRG